MIGFLKCKLLGIHTFTRIEHWVSRTSGTKAKTRHKIKMCCKHCKKYSGKSYSMKEWEKAFGERGTY